jgi:DNA-binding cell septation regulator SpoVG
VQIELDNNKITNYSIVKEGMNVLGCENLNEVFFDVFEIKSNGLDLIKEKRGEFDGNPIIEMDLKLGDQIYKNVRFVLTKENKICINPNLLDHTKIMVQEKKQAKVKPPEPKTEFKREIKPIVKETVVLKEDPIIKEESLIEKTKKEFFESLKGEVLEELKREVRAGIIADLIKENLQTNFDTVIQDNGNKNKLQRILENFNNSFRKEFIDLAEKVSRREALRYAESGGGTNAVQYANGGIMNGDLTVTGNFQSDTMSVNGISVDTLSVNTLSTNNEFVIHNLSVSEGISARDINVDTLTVNTLSTNNEFVIHNLSVSEGITAQNIAVDTLNVKTLYTDNEFVIHNLSVTEGISANSLLLYDTLSAGNSIYSKYGEFYDLTINNNLSVINNIQGNTASFDILTVNSLTATDIFNNTIFTSAFTADSATITNNLITNYETINND